jgi:hypothetical protein
MAKQPSLGRRALDLLIESFPQGSRERDVIRWTDAQIQMRLPTRQRKGSWLKARDGVLFDTTTEDQAFRNGLEDYWSLVRRLARKLKADHVKVGCGLMSSFRHYLRPYATGPRRRIPGSPAKSRREKRGEQLELDF